MAKNAPEGGASKSEPTGAPGTVNRKWFRKTEEKRTAGRPESLFSLKEGSQNKGLQETIHLEIPTAIWAAS
jgi:hypothetical protein